MDTRVGYPNEHLAGDTDKDVTSPLYSTAVGLVMDGLSRLEKYNEDTEENKEQEVLHNDKQNTADNEENKPKIKRVSFLEKLTKNLQEFLDKAE